MSSSYAGASTQLAVSANLASLEHRNLQVFGNYQRTFFAGSWRTNEADVITSARLARVLHDHGIRAGDRVLAFLPNSPQVLWSFNAVWTLGATIIPAPPQCTAPELSYFIKHSGASLVLTSPLLVNQAWAGCKLVGVTKCLCFGASEIESIPDISRQIEDGPSIDVPFDCAPGMLALILYTSGTTARPKGVMLTHGNLAAAINAVTQANGDIEHAPMLHVLPLTHIFGLLMLQLANKWGFRSVLIPQFDPLAVLDAIQRYEIGYMLLVPTMLNYLLRHPQRASFDTSSLRRVITGGAPIPEPLRQDFEREFRCRVEQGYGMTETGFVACYGEDEAYRQGSVGRPCPTFECKIVNEYGVELSSGEPGELYVKAPSVTSCYWKDPELTASAFSDGWFHTGDIGYLDDDKYLYITDRKKDLIIKGGENISPSEIEEALAAHPGVMEVAVIGVPDERFGEEICAVILRKPESDLFEESVIEFASKKLNRFKVPSRVVFETTLPRNAAGKVNKRMLREQLVRK